MTSARKIRTVHEYPPIPDRSHDWYAYDETTYDPEPGSKGHILGWGRTEEAAIEDLIENLEEVRKVSQ